MSLDLKAQRDVLHCTKSVLQTQLGKLGKNNGFNPMAHTADITRILNILQPNDVLLCKGSC